MNIIFLHETDRHPHFMGDVQIIHDLQLMYRTFTSYIRHTEHSCFTVDVQVTPSPWKMVRTPKNQQSTDNNYLSVIRNNLPTPSPTT